MRRGVALLGIALADAVAVAAAAPAPVDFARDVYPVFQRECFECHGPENQKSGLRLDVRERAFKSEGVIAKGNAAESDLYYRITRPKDHSDAMPNRGEPLPAAEIERIKAWIDAGAPWPDDVKPAPHWAYVKPVKPALPAVATEPVSPTGTRETPPAAPLNAIDRFIRARLEREKLSPSPEADPATLCRRVHLDLTGLPPAPAEVDAFLGEARRNTLAQAYATLVDRLLASPHFGERWARPWLDLARYADSHGYQKDDLRDLWPYRDWVVRALNADMPFDQFTIEQLAGDLLPNATDDQRIATGFNRCTPISIENGSVPEEQRVNQVLDRVNTLGAVWLGTTLECAQCHTHKYDPITHKDYYQLYAFFNSTAIEANLKKPEVVSSIVFLESYFPLKESARDGPRAAAEASVAALKSAMAAREQELAHEVDAFAAQLAQAPAATVAALVAKPAATRAAAADDDDGEAATPMTSADLAAILATAKPQRTPAQTKKLAAFHAAQDKRLADLRTQLRAAEQRLSLEHGFRTLVMEELPEPRPSHIFNRGVYTDKGEAVEPGVPAVLHALPRDRPPTRPANRLDLARWLVDRENPLVARVTVNRWWAELFGRGLVATVEDFGLKGERPTHPELLDWLAVELMDNGWSMKHVLRTIVLSATYRQSSRVTPELLARDDQNKLYARGPRLRMDAEMIRDHALTVSGLLSRKLGGPPVRPYQPDGTWVKVGGVRYDYVVSPGEEKYRRGLYVVLKRGAPYPSFMNFDASARMACKVKRSRSNTPLQALTLLNDPVYVEAAMALARRVLRETPSASPAERVLHAFRLCLSRLPTDSEAQALAALHAAELLSYRQEPQAAQDLIAAATRFASPDSSAGTAAADPAELAAWYAVATALFNLDEAITKG